MRKNNESGIALITVLCLLMVVMLLAASAVALSQYAEMDSNTYSSFTRSTYVAEGAANRVYWLILNDRKKYPQRNISPDENTINTEGERFIADGTPRVLKDYNGQDITYEIRDAVSGMDMSGSMPQRDLISIMSGMQRGSAEWQKVETISNKLQDYVDTDDIARNNSLEFKEYQSLELYNLPRNRPFQYREEILLIPGIRELCQPDEHGRMTTIRLIAPQGLSPVSGRPSLYSTPVDQIAERCRLSAIETEQLKEAFKLWTSDKKPLKDSLPAGFLKRLEIYYANSESGYYTLIINTSTEKSPGLRLGITFKSEFTTKSNREFYEYMIY